MNGSRTINRVIAVSLLNGVPACLACPKISACPRVFQCRGVPSCLSNFGVPFQIFGVPFQIFGVPFQIFGVPFQNFGVPFQNFAVTFQNFAVTFGKSEVKPNKHQHTKCFARLRTAVFPYKKISDFFSYIVVFIGLNLYNQRIIYPLF